VDIEDTFEGVQAAVRSRAQNEPACTQASGKDQAVKGNLRGRTTGYEYPECAFPEAGIFPISFAGDSLDLAAERPTDFIELPIGFGSVSDTEQ
jgi:hypothetical protein